MSKWLTTIIAAAISAYACGVVVQHGTPIDNALPLIAVIVTAVAAVTHPAVQLAIPLLMGGEMVIADERLRLLWFGLVVAAALCHPQRSEGAGWWRPAILTIGSILILRWIPISEVMPGRELVLLALALAIVAALEWTTIGVAIAVSVALFTPAIPMRTLAFPLAVLIVLILLRVAGMPRLRAEWLGSAALAVMLLFFAWSGVLARALPLALLGLPASTPRAPVHMALAAGEAVTLDVPSGANAIILSGANLSRMQPGVRVGSINRMPVRIGEVADWGFLRREHFYGARNRPPSNPAGELRGYGQTAWVDGAGRVEIPTGVRTLRVSADPHLPPAARLQIDAFELVPP
ncbi:MAG TPA: hypothetical protein VLV78_22090 [Thermoanaerobaculia bacterium]|nr:hypothetical protein [Thermoanaerobaculia bacterium]